MSKLSHYSGCYFPTVWMDHNCNLKFAVGIIFCYFWETFDSESNKHPSSVHHCCQGLRDERLNFCMRLSFYSREPYIPTWRRTYSDRNSWLFCFKKYTKRIPTSQENTSKIMWVYGFEKTILKTASTSICSIQVLQWKEW